jgi:colicin import membrane protein
MLAILLHIAIGAIFLFAVGWDRQIVEPMPLAINAKLVAAVPDYVPPAIREPEPDPEPVIEEPEPEPEPVVEEPEPERPDPAEQARAKAEEQMRLDEMRKEQQRQQEVERARLQRIEDEKAEAERKAAEAEAKRKAAADEAKRKAEEEAELERKRVEAERLRQENERKQREENERKRREAEAALLQEQIDAENARIEARNSNEMAAYMFAIRQKVERRWVAPPTAPPDLECEVVVRQQPSGDVISAQVVRCNGDAAVVRSIEAAVFKASPLPQPSLRDLFDTNLRFIFKPEQ